MVDNVNIEENSGCELFNYVLLEGIQWEWVVGVFINLQNEQFLFFNIEDLCNGVICLVFKVINMDMWVYECFKMFIYVEEKNGMEILEGVIFIFVCLGSDFQGNYYEYEILLMMLEVEDLLGVLISFFYKNVVWWLDNGFDFVLKDFVEFKKWCNEGGVNLSEEYVEQQQVGFKIYCLKIRGNFSVGQVKVLMVGV